MRLWIAVFLHSLPLDAVRPYWFRDDGGAGCAVLDAARVAALTPAAQRAGAQLGMRRASLSAIAPQCEQIERQPAAEAQAQQGAAFALLQYTPQLAMPDASALLLDVGASLQLFGGPRALARRVAATLAAQGVQATLGLAPTALGAWLLAHQPARRGAQVATGAPTDPTADLAPDGSPRPVRGKAHATGGQPLQAVGEPLSRRARRPAILRVALRQDSLERRLDALPILLLPQARERLDWLHDLGCHTLGQARHLPRAGLQRRGCGPLLKALDAAYGAAPEPHPWITPPPDFHQRIELPDYLEQADALLAVARRLADQLCGWLAAHQRAVQRITLELSHERGRHARPPTELLLAMAQPAWHGGHLIDLLRERLGRLELQAPVIAVTLHAPETVERPDASATLFPDPATQPADHARLLDLLTARLGAQRVRLARPRADHRPEQANAWQDAQAAGGKPRTPALPPSLERPFWLCDPPVELRVDRDNPVYAGQPLKLLRGPERIESGWWDGGDTQRDYFVAEDAGSARYWVYRERDKLDARWFLHGRYA
ncbi:Y-family DNA polymerase [Bordetella ansorpii]|uniref:Y-family DNA polymerase n=1 Tax=Bordetella ansorpii TaxID=288768 RepID=UPI00082B2C63|nr:DNA polymerase Y family protein [Bordetella ansorpii]